MATNLFFLMILDRAHTQSYLLLVGAFLVKSARLLQWLVFISFFFVRPQSHSDGATFLTIETTKTTTIRPSPVSGNQCKRVLPFIFYFFNVTYKTGRD